MRTRGYQNYLDHEVLTASPLKTVELIYRGAVDSIASARRYLRAGDIRRRSRAISKAMAIVTELSLALDYEKGGEMARNLAALYAYVEKLLIRANTEQSEPPLAEAERLLSTLLEAWTKCAQRDAIATSMQTSPAETLKYEPISCAV